MARTSTRPDKISPEIEMDVCKNKGVATISKSVMIECSSLNPRILVSLYIINRISADRKAFNTRMESIPKSNTLIAIPGIKVDIVNMYGAARRRGSLNKQLLAA